MSDSASISAATAAATALYQEVLNGLSGATLSFDADVLRSCVCFPLRFTTQNENFIIETEEDWLASARVFHDNLVSQGVDKFVCIVRAAEFLSANYIEGRHVSYTLRNDEKVVPEYENRCSLTRVNGSWRINAIESAMLNKNWPIHTPRIDTSVPPSWDKISADADARRRATEPLAIYQSFLDRLSLINMENDVESWNQMCEFPHTVHIEKLDKVIEGPAQIRPFLDTFAALIKEHGITSINRQATGAELIGPNQICGYHVTTLKADDIVKVGPVNSRYVLNRSDTRWRMSSVTNSISNDTFPYSQPQVSSALISLREIQKRMRNE